MMKVIVNKIPTEANGCLFSRYPIKFDEDDHSILPKCSFKVDHSIVGTDNHNWTYKPSKYTCSLCAGEECPYLESNKVKNLIIKKSGHTANRGNTTTGYCSTSQQEKHISTINEKNVYCPWCGKTVNKADLFDAGTDVYEEGETEAICPHCHEKFWICTSISYKYETNREKQY